MPFAIRYFLCVNGSSVKNHPPMFTVFVVGLNNSMKSMVVSEWLKTSLISTGAIEFVGSSAPGEPPTSELARQFTALSGSTFVFGSLRHERITWLGALGATAQGARIGTSVLTPTMRYHPSVVAQAYATLAQISAGPVFLGIGSGEAMNETPATGAEWPGAKERRMRLAESIKLIRHLWTEERVDFEGEYYRTVRATIYERPDAAIPIYVAAAGPLAAKLVGRAADGFICTSGKPMELYTSLLENVDEGAAAAGRDSAGIAKMIEIKVSYDTELERAERACHWWGALALTSEEKMSIGGPARARAARRRASGARRVTVHRDDRPRRGGRPHRAVRRAGVHRARLPWSRRGPGALPRALHPRRAPPPARQVRMTA